MSTWTPSTCSCSMIRSRSGYLASTVPARLAWDWSEWKAPGSVSIRFHWDGPNVVVGRSAEGTEAEGALGSRPQVAVTIDTDFRPLPGC